MQLNIEPDVSIPLPPDNVPFADLKELAEAACKSAELLELDTSSSEEVKSAAEQTLYKYAEDPEKTSKQIAKKPNALSAATFKEVKSLLDEFSVRVVDNATQIRLLVTNRLILDSDNEDPRIRLRALELLGKITDVGLFTEKSEVTVINRSTEDLNNSLREKIRRLMRPDNVTDVDAVEVNGEAINVAEELGLPDEENTDGQTENTENSAD